jgi:hypothetical protein
MFQRAFSWGHPAMIALKTTARLLFVQGEMAQMPVSQVLIFGMSDWSGAVLIIAAIPAGLRQLLSQVSTVRRPKLPYDHARSIGRCGHFYQSRLTCRRDAGAVRLTMVSETCWCTDPAHTYFALQRQQRPRQLWLGAKR